MSWWEDDKKATDPYLPMVKAICGAYLINEAPTEEDQLHNTDLMVFTMGSLRIAVRLRSPIYWHGGGGLWRQEFTIRDSRPNGIVTEFAKILHGFGDYFFYGFRHHTPPHLLGFGLMALSPFREWCQDFQHKHKGWPGRIRKNGDSSSTFRCIRWDVIPPSAILVMYPAKIAIGDTLISKATQEAIQLSLGLIFD